MTVSGWVGVLNLILGSVYTSYGIMTIVDMKRGWRTHGFSHFGLAWIAMAFTCGPHHLVHGAHVLLEGRIGGPLDLAVVAFGFPAGVIWFLLRLEAVAGGPGDRRIQGTPAWVESLPTVSGVYLAALVTAVIGVGGALPFRPAITPQLFLIVLYAAIGAVLLRTQLINHAFHGGWSLSGLALTFVFPTCGIMHGIYAFYIVSGRYAADWHGLWIDSIGVPAAAYFLWVVWSLHRGSIHDWNEAAGDTLVHERPGDDEAGADLLGVRI
jgi:hypothetical protein